MSLLLEQVRSLNADLERNILKISDELQHKASTKKQTVHQDHRINHYLNQIQKDASNLKQLFLQESNQAFENQLRAMTSRYDLNETIQGFERAIRDIQIHYQKADEKGGRGVVFGTLAERQEQQLLDLPFYERIEKEHEFLVKHSILPTFTSEERYGKYVDLTQNFSEFQALSKIQQFIKRLLSPTANTSTNASTNVSNITQGSSSSDAGGDLRNGIDSDNPLITNYSTYLLHFYKFEFYDVSLKDHEYLEYLKNLYNYFIDFLQRTQPLIQISESLSIVEEDFKHEWEEGTLCGWEKVLSQRNEQPDLQNVDLTSNSKKKTRRGGKRKRLSLDTSYETALLETKIKHFASMFYEEIQATLRYIEKKQTFTWEELQADVERDEEIESRIPEEEKARQVKEKAEDSGDRNKFLDDESTMPLWLFKRRGLNIEYKCEICGNYSYRGPQVFKRHFQEWRHQYGMNCLKIPNSKHFFGITSIKEALELWEKMKQDKSREEFTPEDMELEDEMGNVYDLKTFEDLKKQGLL